MTPSLFAQEVQVVSFPEFQARLQQQNDTLHIYNFWATWCKPCVKELPYFVQVQEKYRDQAVKFVYVSLDFEDYLPIVKKLAQAKQLNSDVLLLNESDANSYIDKVSPKWTGAIPASLAVHTPSKTYEFKEQSFTYEELDAWVKALQKSN